MTLTKVEQETIVLFNEAEATASVYTHGYCWNCVNPTRPRPAGRRTTGMAA